MPKQPPPTPLHYTEKLRLARNLNNPTDQQLAPLRNHRNMFVVKETIHHGDVFIQRRMEVPRLDASVAAALLLSSPYSYGDWLHEPGISAESQAHRQQCLREMVADLRNFRSSRIVGWSTFKLDLGEEP